MDSKDVKYNYLFAQINGSDVLSHGKVIIDSKNLQYNYYFTKIYGSDILSHDKVILDSNDLFYIFLFAKDVPGINIKAHEKKILESKDDYYIGKFYEEIIKKSNDSLSFEKSYYDENLNILFDNYHQRNTNKDFKRK